MRQPCDPFDYHVYVAGCERDEDDIQRLIRHLRDHHVSCCCRQDHKPNDGIAFSERCLIYVSRNCSVLDDADFEAELNEVVNKQFHGSDRVVLLLNDINLVDVRWNLDRFGNLKITSWPMIDEFISETFLSTELTVYQLPRRPELVSGASDAIEYFVDYLQFVLASFRECLETTIAKTGIHPSPTDTAAGDVKYIRPLLLILPDTCWAPPHMFERSPDRIVYTNDGSDKRCVFVRKYLDRGGEKRRCYKHALMKIWIESDDNSGRKTDYYFAGEFPCSLLTMYEAYTSNAIGMKLEGLYEQRDNFTTTLENLLRLYSDEFGGLYRIVRWHNIGCDVEDSLYDCVVNVVRSLPEADVGNVSDIDVNRRESGDMDVDSPSAFNANRCTIVYSGCLPARVAFDANELLHPYYIRRGLCINISIDVYDDDSTTVDGTADGQLGLLGVQVRNRGGTSPQIMDKLRLLFRHTNFELVPIDGHVTKEVLERKLDEIRRFVDSNCDSLFCFVSSRGVRGSVRTSDNLQVRAQKLTEYFSDERCANLKGKPKVFFFHTRSGQPSSSSSTASSLQEPMSQMSVEGVRHLSRPGRRPVHEEINDDVDPFEATAEEQELLLPPHEDFMISYLTLNDRQYSAYIEELASQLHETDYRVEFDCELLERVQARVKRMDLGDTSSSGVSRFDSPINLSSIVYKNLFFIFEKLF